MPKFSPRSEAQLETCHPELRYLAREVIKDWDCTVLEGRRTKQQQAANVAKGVSKTMLSKHLPEYSQDALWGVDAMDLAPYPLRWPQKAKDASPEELKRWMKECALWYYFAGFVKATAVRLGLRIIWGGDWDDDHDILEQNFDDLPHFERVRT